MALEVLVVTADPEVLELVRRTVQSFGASVVSVANAQEGALMVARRKFDAIVVECNKDAVPGSSRLLQEIRRGTSNRSSIVFALIGSTTTTRMALADGANFVLQKPLQPHHVVHTFNSALRLMRREHRRYFRLAIELPVQLAGERGEMHTSTTINLSKKGLALRDCVLDTGTRSRIQFALPGRRPMECDAEVAWKTHTGTGHAGLRILAMDEGDRGSYFEFIDRAAEDAEIAPSPSTRDRSVLIGEQGNWWHMLRRRILRAVGRWAK